MDKIVNEPLEMLETTMPPLEVAGVEGTREGDSEARARFHEAVEAVQEAAAVRRETDNSDPKAAARASARVIRDMANALRADTEETIRCGNCLAFQPQDDDNPESHCTLDAPRGHTPRKGERDWCPQFRLGARGVQLQQQPKPQPKPPMAVAQGPGRDPEGRKRRV
jgi:hypothetical protein